MFQVENFLLFLLVLLDLVELMRYYLDVPVCLIKHRIKEVHLEVHVITGLVLLEHVSFHGLLIIQMALTHGVVLHIL